jgi:hypothetical protein
MNSQILFSERQRFKQIWLWILSIGINGISLYGLIKQVFLGERFGDRPMSNIGVITFTIFTISISLLLLNMRLDTTIKTDGIYVRFFPFQRTFRFYAWDKLNQAYVRQYSPMGEYGGWGIRGFRSNRAFNISGNMGIQLIMEDGRKFLIGTNKAAEVTETLRQLGQLTNLQSQKKNIFGPLS